jgi:hypothetical protein
MEDIQETSTITSWQEALRIVPTRKEYNENNIPEEAKNRSYPKPEGIDYRKELLDKDAKQDFYLYHMGQMVVNKLGNLVYVIPPGEELDKFKRLMHLFNTRQDRDPASDENLVAEQVDKARKIILLAFADTFNIEVDENDPDYDSLQKQTVDYLCQIAANFDFPFPEAIKGKGSENGMPDFQKSFNENLNQAKKWVENKVDKTTGKKYRQLHPKPFAYIVDPGYISLKTSEA